MKWRKFWEKIFSYIRKHNLPLFDTFFFLVSVPSLVHGIGNPALARVLSPYFPEGSPPPEGKILAGAMNLLRDAISVWHTTGKIPKKYWDGLSVLWNLIIKDYNQAPPLYAKLDVEDLLEEQDNIAERVIQPRSWFFLKTILEDADPEPLRKIINRSLEEESREDQQTAELHPVVASFLEEKQIRKYLEAYLREKRVADEDVILASLGAKDAGDFVLIKKPLERLFFALVLFHMHSSSEVKEYIEALQGKLKSLEEKVKSLKKELREKEELIKKLRQKGEKIKVEKIIVDRSAARVEELERENERLKEQLRQANEALNLLVEEEEGIEEEVVPFSSPVEINYFGRKSTELERALSGYNVRVRFFPTDEIPKELPGGLLVLNISSVPHKLTYKLALEKERLVKVAGSNAEILAKTIVYRLKKKIKGGEETTMKT